VLLKSFKAAEFPAKFYSPATLDKTKQAETNEQDDQSVK